MWQQNQLDKFMETYKEDAFLDSRSVFLQNPQQGAEIEEVIIDKIWPGVVRAIQASDLEIWITPGKTLKEAIDDKNHKYTTKELVFLLDDPKRPLGPNSKRPWYCRCRIECSALSYMIGSDFMVYFPEDFSIAKILRLLKDPMMQGCPPELSYEESPLSNSVYVVSFTKGQGAGWGLCSTDKAREQIYSVIKKNIAVIGAVGKLEKDYSNTRLFNKLHETIIDAYENN